MLKLKVQMRCKAQMIKFIREEIFDIESFCHSFDICLPAGRQGF
jgi:hypothetical protein